MVISVYNKSEWIGRCLRSICAQTYRDLEIIPVDDGSTDDSGRICDDMAKTDPRIRVIHKKNGGNASARNAGLDAAKGRYVTFVDADDYLEPEMYEEMLKVMEESGASIVNSGIIATDLDGTTKTVVGSRPGLYTPAEAMQDFFSRGGNMTPPAWTKLYRREIFHDRVRFDDRVIHEDTEAMPRFIDASESIYVLDKAFYHYIKDVNSVSMSKKFSMRGYRILASFGDYREMCREKYPEVLPTLAFYELTTTNEMYRNLMGCVDRDDYRKQQKELRRGMIGCALKAICYKKVRNKYGDLIKNSLYLGLRGLREKSEDISWRN